MSDPRRRRPFDRRAFVAIGATATGLALPLGGLGDHLHQHTPATAGLEAWSAFHTACGVLFTGFVIGHVVLNRKAYMRYARTLARGTRRSRAGATTPGAAAEGRGSRSGRRRTVSLWASGTGLILAVSGLFDHLLQGSPDSAGFILARTLHWGCAVLFMLLVGAHLVLNRKPYLRYVHELGARLPLLTREAGVVAALLAVVLVPAVGHTLLGRAP